MPSTMHRILLAAALVSICASARPADLRREPVARGDAQAGAAKAEVCTTCHGRDGIAIAPMFPNLAGQSVTYQVLQLRAYQDGSRPNAVMRTMVEFLSDQEKIDVSA